MTTKIINRRCQPGQSVFDVIDTLISEKLISERSMLGTRATGTAPNDAVARVTVRPNESWWIVNPLCAQPEALYPAERYPNE
jgi:hypothetical protein